MPAVPTSAQGTPAAWLLTDWMACIFVTSRNLGGEPLSLIASVKSLHWHSQRWLPALTSHAPTVTMGFRGDYSCRYCRTAFLVNTVVSLRSHLRCTNAGCPGRRCFLAYCEGISDALQQCPCFREVLTIPAGGKNSPLLPLIALFE